MKTLFASLIVLLTVVSAYPQCEKGAPVTYSGRRYSLGEQYPAGAPAHRIGEPGSRYLRVNVHVEDPGRDWILNVRDDSYHLIQAFTPADFAKTHDRWTARIPGSAAQFELNATPGAAPVIRFDYFVAMPQDAKGSYYSLQGSIPTYVPLYTTEGVSANRRRLGDYTGVLMTSDGTQSWSCTGVMLTASLFLTNWHCGAPLNAPDDYHWLDTELKESLIDLSWDDDGLSSDYVVSAVEATDPDLDYALLRVAPVGRPAVIHGPRIDTQPIRSGGIFIIHHPVANQKRISECRVQSVDHASWREHKTGTDFTHVCDTEGGSSGAPVFSDSGALIGLHHLSFDYDENCRRLDKENKAVKISAIVESIRSKKKELLNEMRFEPPLP